MTEKPILFLKAHVRGYVRKDGTQVTPHERAIAATIKRWHSAMAARNMAKLKGQNGNRARHENRIGELNDELAGHVHAWHAEQPEHPVVQAGIAAFGHEGEWRANIDPEAFIEAFDKHRQG